MKNQNKKKIIALAILSIFLLTEVFPFFNGSLNKINQKEEDESEKQKYIHASGNFTYISKVDQTNYPFNAKGECYILAKVNGTDFTSFQLDGEVYNVSYGLNSFSKDFGEEWESHSITIDSSDLYDEDSNLIFEWLCVEPLYLAENNTIVNLLEETIINFDGGGPISILLQPEFLYNYLYIEILELGSKSIVLKDVFDPDEGYPEINSQEYSSLIEGGMYISFDLDLKPGSHSMILYGNGSIDYKIMVNLDWDNDLLGDVEEIQQSHLHHLDPIIPNCWGYFEKSENIMTGYSEGYADGHYRFFIPDSNVGSHYLYIDMIEGDFSNFKVDNDDLTYKDMYFSINPYISNRQSRFYGSINPGIHDIFYQYDCKKPAVIFFRLNSETIITIDDSTTLDTDGDGLKDYSEYKCGLNPYKVDTDDDGLPDIFDASPLSSLVLDKNKMGQVVLPHNPSKNTLINLIVKKPTKDYSTYINPRLWNNALNVSIYFVMRLFGNETITRDEIVSFWKYDNNNVESYSLVDGYNCYGTGDALPNEDYPNAEFTFIPPKPSLNTFEFDLKFPVGHPAKINDNAIDLRFDFMWLITYFNETSKRDKVIHYYEIGEDILIQSLVSREIDNVSYILGSPDSMIEHQVLWNLAQNPQLSLLGDYNPYIDDDIVGFGSVDYLNLTNQLVEDRQNHPLLGSYNATYNFEDEIDGTSGTNIDFIDRASISTGCSLTIASEIDGHHKVLDFHDDNILGHIVDVKNAIADKVSGTVEFWWRTTDASDYFTIFLKDGISIAVRIYIEDDQFKYFDEIFPQTARSASDNTWYHHKIVFDCTTDRYDWYIDGELEAENVRFFTNFWGVVAIDSMEFTTLWQDADYHNYIDAVGYSWDENYEVGDNQVFNPLENEVLYFAGLTSNFDVLNKINIKENIPNPSFEVNYSGDYQVYFSLNSISADISDVVENLHDFKLLKEENIICYEISWYNFSNEELIKHEQRVDIYGFPICLEVKEFELASVLEVTKTLGEVIPLGYIPLSINDNLYSKIIFEEKIYIEKKDDEFALPTIRYQEDFDIIKEFINYRFDVVIRANLFFELDPEININIYEKFLKHFMKFLKTIDGLELNSLEVSLEAFLIKFQGLNKLFADQLKTLYLHCRNVYNNKIYTDSKTITEFFKALGIKDLILMQKFASKIDFWNELVDQNIGGSTKAAIKKIEALQEIMEKMAVDVKSKNFKVNKLKAKIILYQLGRIAGIIITCVNIGFYIADIVTLFTESGKYWDSGLGITAFCFRLAAALCGVTLSIILLIDLFKVGPLRSTEFMGKVNYLFGLAIKIAQLIGDIFYALSIMEENPRLAAKIIETSFMVTTSLIGIDFLLVFAFGSSWITACLSFLFSLLLYALLIFSPPRVESLTTITDETFLTVPEDNLKRHGGFEVGDTIGFTITFVINETLYGLKARGRFRLIDGNGDVPGDWSDYQGLWDDEKMAIHIGDGYYYWQYLSRYVEDQPWSYEFEQTIHAPILNLTGEYEMEIDTIEHGTSSEYRAWLYGPESSLILFNLPVLENSIMGFYGNTVPLAPIYTLSHLKSMLKTAIEQYQWKNGNELLNSIQEIKPDYGQNINIPVNVNLGTYLSENIIVMDLATDTAEFDFPLILEGDEYPIVNYTFMIPDGFSITSSEISQALNLNIKFNISANDPFEFAGVYYFNMTVSISDTIIYFERIPFRIPFVEDVQLIQSNIITETTTYGNYTASIDFLDEVIGEKPSGWEGGWWEENHPTLSVISEMDEHNNVFELKTSNDYPALAYYDFETNYDDRPTEGTIELWLRKSSDMDNNKIPLYIGLGLGLANGIVLRIDLENNGKVQASIPGRNNEGFYDICNGFRFKLDTWYLFRLDFNCSSQDYDLYINGIILEENIPFEEDSSCIEYMYLGEWYFDGEFHFTTMKGTWYVDAIGIEWDSSKIVGDYEYHTGDNMFKTDIESEEYGNSVQLKKGDIINIEYKTNNPNEVLMIFINDDEVQETYSVIPRGNLNVGYGFDQIIIKESITFDQIEFSAHQYRNFEVTKLSIIDACVIESQRFNPFNLTNNGNIPEYVTFSFSGVPFEKVDQSLYPDEFFGEEQIALILPNSNRVSEFDIELPDESISNLLWRGIICSNTGTNEVYNFYIDNLEIDGIHVVTPKNTTYYITGKPVTHAYNEFSLDIISEENLVWSAYSLNGQQNITFLGTANITLPTFEGINTIQVFGNNSDGVNYASEVRYFTVEHFYMELLIPENDKYYSIGDDGYFAGTYGFEYHDYGTQSTDIDFIDIDYTNYQQSCELEIKDLIGDHRNVLSIVDWSSSYYCDMYNIFDSAQNKGIIEFYIRTTDIYKRVVLQLWDDNDKILLRYRIDNGYHQAYPISGNWGNVISATTDHWYHIRIDFTTNGSYNGLFENTWMLYIDGENFGPYGMENDDISPTKLRVATSSTDGSYTGYLDAIGYSWAGYEIGDNLETGLLIGYETALASTMYVLDGKEIQNGKVIPLKPYGNHSFQLVGWNSEGTKYQTDIISFNTEDKIGPNIYDITISNNPLYRFDIQTITCTIEDYSGIQSATVTIQYLLFGYLEIDITTLRMINIGGNTYQAQWDSSGAIYGIYLVDFYAIDSNVNQNPTYINNGILFSVVEPPPPTVDITSPNDGATVSYTVTIRAQAASEAGLTKVQFKIDNILKHEDTNGANGWTYYWDSRTVSNGWHTLKCIAYDTLGRTVSDSISVNVQNGGGGGGCPILSVYDGEQYVTEGLLDIHNLEGKDVIYYHTLINTPLNVNNRYLLCLTEHYKTISHIDNVKFYGRLHNGRLIPLPLLSAIHSKSGQVRGLLWFSDDRRVDILGADYNNDMSEYINLEFFSPRFLNFKEFIFVIEGNNVIVK